MKEVAIFDKEYNCTFGILTAMAIVFVVAGHLNCNILTADGLLPYYSYHMGLFVFISGYFYKPEYEENIGVFFLKKFKRLIIPYFCWNLFYGIIVIILRNFGFSIGSDLNFYTLLIQPFVDGHQFYFNLSAWFLLMLFIVESVYLFSRKLFRMLMSNDNICLVSMLGITLIVGLCGIILANIGYNYSFWLPLVRTMFFLPFYCFGNVYKRILEKYDILNNIVYLGIIIGVQFLVIMHYGWIPTFSAAFGSFFYNPVMQYITAFNGIAFWLRIAKIITPIVNREGYIIKLGKCSFTVMMHHIGVIYLLEILLYFISKITYLFGDIDINVIKNSAGSWYLPRGNNYFLLFYLVMTLTICVIAGQIGNKLKKSWCKSKKR